jgi:uncharacterized protein (TIGR03086 family)
MTAPPHGRELLGQAIDYALASAALVTPSLLACPTPCCAWNLGMLLAHLGESLDALAEGFIDGTVAPPPAAEAAAELAGATATATAADAGPAGLRARCDRLRAAAASPDAQAGRLVAIGGHAMPTAVLSCTGAIEIAVHGWDISVACGTRQPVPPGLAAVLLPIAPLLITSSTRPGLFAAPVQLPGPACPGDQLVAFLGRQPRPHQASA